MNPEKLKIILEKELLGEFHKYQVILSTQKKVNNVTAIITSILQDKFLEENNRNGRLFNKIFYSVKDIVKNNIKFGVIIINPKEFSGRIISEVILALKE